MLNIKENIYKYLLPNLLEIQRASFCWFLEKGLIQEFEDLKSKLLSKEQFDYTKERNVFNDIINKLSGFFKLRDYGDNNSPRSLITKAEISALNGDLKSVLYYLEKLPDDWKVGLKNFISKCKLFLAKENG